MHKFTLLHDGSDQGWQATYLAFHVAARLGAPLQVLLVGHGEKTHDENATQVEVGGRAAGVTIDARLLIDFSIERLKKNVATTDGLFIPLRLVPDGNAVSRFLEAYHCPLWIVSKDSENRGLGVLIKDSAQDTQLLAYVKTLSNRLQQSVIVLVAETMPETFLKTELAGLTWKRVPGVSPENIAQSMIQHHIDLLFVSVSDQDLLDKVPGTLVIYSKGQDA